MRVVLRIDAEPDGFAIDKDQGTAWTEFEAGLSFAARLRDQVADAGRGRARLSWGVRIDAQVAHGYGNPAWILEEQAEAFDALRAQGDDVGLHVHFFRPRPDGRWLVDLQDQAWGASLLEGAWRAFREATGRQPDFFVSGNKMTTQAIVDVVRRLGIPIDGSAEPGLLVRATRNHVAEDCDFRGVPAQPYEPDGKDFRRPASQPSDGFRMVPCTTGRPQFTWHRVHQRAALRARACLQQRLPPWVAPASTLNLGQRPWQFQAILEDALRAGPDVLHVPMRNCPHPERAQANLDELLRHDVAFVPFTEIVRSPPPSVAQRKPRRSSSLPSRPVTK